ncbi:MAG: GAF domain-containing sensor histidine kinase [Vicinamibacterales bacterium]
MSARSWECSARSWLSRRSASSSDRSRRRVCCSSLSRPAPHGGIGPRAGIIGAFLGLAAAHVLRFVESPETFRHPQALFTRGYWIGISVYAVFCALFIALGRWRQSALWRLDAVRDASEAAELAYHQNLEAALARETVARQAAEDANARAEDMQRRLMGLVAASSTLLRSPRVHDVLTAMVSLAEDVLPADAYAIWRAEGEQPWRIVSASGLDDRFIQAAEWSRLLRHFDEPRPIECIRNLNLSPELHQAYADEGIESMLVVPLLQNDTVRGVVAFYYRQRHTFHAHDLQAAGAFGNLASAALTTAELYDRQRRTRLESEFLADAGTVLSSSLDYQITLRQVARLAVPEFADFCAVDLVGANGVLERLAVEHVDPAQVQLAQDYRQRYSDDPRSPLSTANVIRTGGPVLLEQLTDDMLAADAIDAEHRAEVQRLGIRSAMIVPMVARDEGFGALTFALVGATRRYTREDLRLAMALASRAALAVDNARAYGEATRANRLKDEFLAVLSHELRTPLNAVLGYARMLQTGVMNGERLQRAFATLERNAHVLSRLVEDVLEVSRFMAGKVTLRRGPVDLTAIVEQVAATVRPVVDQKNLELRQEIQRPLPRIDGDADRLQQVIFNLLSNAVKFTPAGGTVTVRVVAEAPGVTLVVSDSGLGIPAEFLPFVFDRFRQADGSVTREHGGLGLGLAITKDIVELHGGRIEVASGGPDKGAEFRVSLPLGTTMDADVVDQASQLQELR